ncbi:sensor histidine kinase [Streptococcus iniae]|uniref:sensor histidine kinase n=1 Tax=Streptococcus iniae TaxID=1346 RepID=UPI0034A14146
MRKKRSLWASLSLILITMIAVTTSIFYGIMIRETYHSIKSQEIHLLTSTGKMLASNQLISDNLRADKADQTIINYSNTIAKTFHLDYVVVMNMQGIRLTHPNPQKIGKPFQGGDEKEALEGKTVLSTAKGSLGKSLRYLVPVYNHKRQIGVVAVGIKLTTINDVALKSKKNYTIALVISIVISLFATTLISLHLKKQLHNLEPSEIYQLLEERDAMLDQMDASVFIITKSHTIHQYNQAAKELVLKHLPQKTVLGVKIEDLIPAFSKIDFSKNNEQLLRFCEEDFLISISPINVKGELRGYIIFLRHAIDSIYLLDQLAYSTTYASALQAQTHTFMNRLHVIYGLVDIAYYDQLKIYLDSLLQPENEIINSLSVLIKEPLLASFLIGEQEKFKELAVTINYHIMREIPASQSKNDLNHCLIFCRFIDTHLLNHFKPETVTVSMDYQVEKLIIRYTILDSNMSKMDLETIFKMHYFQQLLEGTNSKYYPDTSQKTLSFTITTPYNGG